MKREDAGNAGNQTTPAKADEAQAPLTRADVTAIVTEAVAAALAAKPADVVRADDTKPAETKLAEETAPAALTRADLEEAVNKAVAPLTEQIETLKSTTVVRSTGEAVVKPAGEKKEDVFRGVFAANLTK